MLGQDILTKFLSYIHFAYSRKKMFWIGWFQGKIQQVCHLVKKMVLRSHGFDTHVLLHSKALKVTRDLAYFCERIALFYCESFAHKLISLSLLGEFQNTTHSNVILIKHNSQNCHVKRSVKYPPRASFWSCWYWHFDMIYAGELWNTENGENSF